MTLEEQLENLEKETMEKISNISDLDSLNDIRVKTLGKKKVLLLKYYAV